jgi:hypothetical protein
LTEEDWLKPDWFFIGDVNIRCLFLIQLSDIVVHERDILMAAGKWKGFDSQLLQPLIDWFMCEFRPASFRHEGNEKLGMTISYKLSGLVEGNWTMHLENGKCYTERDAISKPDILIQADTEDLIITSLARANPMTGSMIRKFAYMLPTSKREDFVATATNYFSFGTAILSKRLRINGKRSKVTKLKKAFWHFGERRKQSEPGIKTSRLSPPHL